MAACSSQMVPILTISGLNAFPVVFLFADYLEIIEDKG